MTLKQFHIIKIITVVALGIIASRAAVLEAYWLISIGLAISMALLLILRGRVKEIIADERDYEISGKAARYSITACAFAGCIIAFILMSLREINALYEVIGSVIAYTVCALLFSYSLIFVYLNKTMSGKGKKLFFIIAAILVLIFAVASLRFFSGDEDTWLCQDGQWEKHGNPSAPMPAKECLK
jgi:uncharacterized membrane protein